MALVHEVFDTPSYNTMRQFSHVSVKIHGLTFAFVLHINFPSSSTEKTLEHSQSKSLLFISSPGELIVYPCPVRPSFTILKRLLRKNVGQSNPNFVLSLYRQSLHINFTFLKSLFVLKSIGDTFCDE